MGVGAVAKRLDGDGIHSLNDVSYAIAETSHWVVGIAYQLTPISYFGGTENVGFGNRRAKMITIAQSPSLTIFKTSNCPLKTKVLILFFPVLYF